MVRMKTERKRWVDVLKGIAIILVVFQYSCGNLYNSGLYMESIFPLLIHGIGIFHMALFMELSGYVFFEVYIKVRESIPEGCAVKLLTYVLYTLSFPF